MFFNITQLNTTMEPTRVTQKRRDARNGEGEKYKLNKNTFPNVATFYINMQTRNSYDKNPGPIYQLPDNFYFLQTTEYRKK